MSVVTRVRAWPRNAATGAVVPVYLAGGNDGRPHHDGANHYMAGVASEPRFEQSISFTDEAWGARAVPAVGGISWKPAEPFRLDALAALYWRDAAIEVDQIKDRAVTRRLTGTVAEATFQDGGLLITCADLTNRLDQAVISATFAGTGGIEGDDVAAGRSKRRSFGRVWNVEGRLLLKAYNIFEFGDPARPLQACVALRDKGKAGPLGILAWQGSVEATLNALKAAQPQQGGGVFAPSIACAKWWTTPSGPLTAEMRGEALGYSENVVGIAAQLLAAANGPQILDANLAAQLRLGAAGLHIRDNNETTPGALNRLLRPVTLIWMLNGAGQVEIREWTFNDPVETLNATFIGRASTLQPVWKRTVGYQRNERIQGDGEISAAVLAGDVIYDDGTTAEDWKPAEPGATKGAPEGTYVAGRPAEEIISDLNLNGLNWHDLSILTESRDAQMLARTTLDGKEVKTVITEFKAEYSEGQTAIAETFSLLGAKNDTGDAFNLNLNSVKVTPTQSFAQYLQAVSARFGDVEGEVTDLRTVLVDAGGGVVAKAVFALDVNGHVVGTVQTNNGQLGEITFVYDRARFLKPDGTLMWGYDETRNIVVIPNVEVDTIKARTVKTATIDANSVTGLWSASYPDVLVSGGEVTLAEIPNYVVGDDTDGKALLEFQFTQDGTSNIDTAIRLRAYMDFGAGYQLVRDVPQGIGVSSGNARWILNSGFKLPILANGSVSIKITAAPYAIPGGGTSNSSYARNILVMIFEGFR